jgi:hypothetical protein
MTGMRLWAIGGGLGLALAPWGPLACAQDAAPVPLAAALATCRAMADQTQRLSCYDHLAGLAQGAAPRWAGRLSFQTETFTIDRPTLLRFESDGVIFVMALKDGHGEVLQNLHHAGAGEGRYLIARPGSYSLQINGAEGWKIWLEPQG